MKIRRAVLQAIGAETPYARSGPLVIEDVDLDPVMFQNSAGLAGSTRLRWPG
jgi:hypothetical protein